MKHRKKNIIPAIGTVVFLTGFLVFNALLFTERYHLSEEAVRKEVGPGFTESFLKNGKGLMGTEYSFNAGFISDVKSVLSKINDEVLEQYSLTEEEINGIAGLFSKDLTVSLDRLGEALDENTSEGSYKAGAIRGYGGWLDGTTFGSGEEIKSALEGVAGNIRKYDIINQKGINSYAAKDLVFRLAKTSSFGPVSERPLLFLVAVFGLMIIGGLMYILPVYTAMPEDIKNNAIFHNPLTSRGLPAMMLGVYLIAFYVVLYFYHEYMTTWILMTDPLSYFLKDSPGGQFFLYGLIYTLLVLVMGIRMMLKYRHSRYHQLRTASVMFFQLGFAFLLPELLMRLKMPYYDFKNAWPLDYDFFFDYELNNLLNSGAIGLFMLVWGIIMIVIIVPLFTYLFGKRWYCSWVCGCGGLAETLGDPFRQLSDKSLRAWKIERWSIHGVLVFAVVMTAAVLYTYFTGSSSLLGIDSYFVRDIYGVWIGAIFAGVAGTGLYPLLGNRVWCRFGCPLAAYMGLIQRFKSRYRITTNGGQCISCGNCSAYCEMGIDVRWYAQRGQDVVRASCVGCGVCSAVCPRGVLGLENKGG